LSGGPAQESQVAADDLVGAQRDRGRPLGVLRRSGGDAQVVVSS
jgi:hypothetical protein